MSGISEGRRYRHFKGTEYVVLHVAWHTETGAELVVYRRADGTDQRVWARPREMFEGLNEAGVPRFVSVDSDVVQGDADPSPRPG